MAWEHGGGSSPQSGNKPAKAKIGGRSVGRNLGRPEVPPTSRGGGGGGGWLIFHSDFLFVSPSLLAQRGKSARTTTTMAAGPSTFETPTLNQR